MQAAEGKQPHRNQGSGKTEDHQSMAWYFGQEQQLRRSAAAVWSLVDGSR